MGDNDSVKSYCTRYLRPQIGCLLKDLSRLQDIVYKRESQTGKRLEAGDTTPEQMSTNSFSLRHRPLSPSGFVNPNLFNEYNRRPKISERNYARENDLNLARRDSAFRSLIFDRMFDLSKLRAERDSFNRDRHVLLNDLETLKSAVDHDRNRRMEEEARLKVLSRELDNKSQVLNKAHASLEELSLTNQRLKEKLRDLQKMEDEIVRLRESRDVCKRATEKRIGELSSEISSLNHRLGVANERMEILQKEKEDLQASNDRLEEKNAVQKEKMTEIENRIERKKKCIFESKDAELRETARKLQNAVDEIKSLEHELYQSKEDIKSARQKRQECLEQLAEEDILRQQTEDDLRRAKAEIEKLSQQHKCFKDDNVLRHHERKELHKRIDYLQHMLRVQEKAAKTMKNTLRMLNVDYDDFDQLEHVAKMQRNLEDEWHRMNNMEAKWKRMSRLGEDFYKSNNKQHLFPCIVRQGINISLFLAMGYLFFSFVLPVIKAVMYL